MKLEVYLNKKITVKQVRGGSKLNPRAKANLVGLGLRGIGSQSVLVATQPVIGMIRKVAQLVNINNN